MTDTITYAMTPEEWGRQEIEFGDEGWAHIEGVFPVAGGEPILVTNELYVGTYDADGKANGGVTVRRHALAALSLFGQPFGFTPFDVNNLLHCADGYDMPQPMRDHFYALATRIAALLPEPTIDLVFPGEPESGPVTRTDNG